MISRLDQLTEKKHLLDQRQPLAPALVRNLDEWYKVELTYTSNAIEGNTLTRHETALVVEKGITVEGKSLREQLEATNHAKAVDYVRELASKRPQDVTEDDLLHLHWLILHGVDDANAGRYRNVPVRVTGSLAVMPNYLKVPEMMAGLVTWLHQDHPDVHPAQLAAEAHYRLVSIHPFVDGNGRTGRLLMNLLLMQAGYPPAVVRPEDRRRYVTALERGQTGGSTVDYYELMYEAVGRSLDLYLTDDLPGAQAVAEQVLVKRSELAMLTGTRPSTIKHYTELGLLPFAQVGIGLARRYDRVEAVQRVHTIRQLQARGLSLEAVRQELRGSHDDVER